MRRMSTKGMTAAGGVDEESDVAHVAEFAHGALETASGVVVGQVQREAFEAADDQVSLADFVERDRVVLIRGAGDALDDGESRGRDLLAQVETTVEAIGRAAAGEFLGSDIALYFGGNVEGVNVEV